MSNSTFSNARIGDEVYCLLHGPGKIVDILLSHTFPIKVRFKDGIENIFTLNGFLWTSHKTPSLYWSKPEITLPAEPMRYKNINGYKVPDIAVNSIPPDSHRLAVPSLIWFVDLYEIHSITDELLKGGVVYPNTDEGRDAAIAHRNAWIGLGEPWIGLGEPWINRKERRRIHLLNIPCET